MAELNLFHIDQITSDVRIQEIGFSHLFHDLTDHICCDVEYHMQQGMSFEEAYSAVKEKIGYRGLKKIQEETLYAVDTKYRNMKKLMKISGIAGTVMLGFAVILKINHLPLAGVLMTLGALVLSFLFLPSALVVLWKETKNGNKLFLFISAFLSGVAFIIGMLFKIQHWPGAGLVISFGLFSGIFIFIPSLLYHLFMDKDKKYKRPLYLTGSLAAMIYCTGFWFRIMHWPLANILILSGSFLIIFIVLPLFTWVQWKTEKYINARFIFMVVAPLLYILPGALVNLNLERNYDGGFYLRMGEQEVLTDIQKVSTRYMLERFSGSPEFQNMEAIHLATENLLGTIRKIQHNMVTISEGPAGTPDKSLLELTGPGINTPVNYDDLKKPFHPAPATQMILPGCQPRNILEAEVSAYKDLLKVYLGAEWTREHDQLMNVSSFLPDTVGNNSDLALTVNINRLSILSSGIMLIESAALKQLSSINKEN